jgi:two-component system chemotaxis sensor kinase CheA
LHELVSEEDIQDKNYINLRTEVLPFIRLRSLFGITEKIDHSRESLVIVQFGTLRAGLVVDSLKGEFQTVVKPLGRLFEGLKCISGATILGSGNVAIILDVSALIKSAISVYESLEIKQ